MASLHYRTIWLADIHPGSRGCNAEFLLNFLTQVESKRLYLVGGKWVALIGGHAYDRLLILNRWFNFFRRKLSFPY